MLLSEQLRNLSKEETLVNDATNYDAPATAHDWTERAAKTIVLSEGAVIHVQYTFTHIASVAYGNSRITLGGVALVSSGRLEGGSVTREAFIYLAAGTHVFSFQIAQWFVSGGYLRISGIIIRRLGFPDGQRETISGSVSVPNNTTETIVNQGFTVQSSRKTPVGNTKQVYAYIVMYLYGVDYRKSRLRNSGDSDESGYLNWKLYWGGNRVSFDAKVEDASSSISDIANGEGAYGLYATAVPLTVGTQYTIRLDCYNLGTGSSRTCEAKISVFTCPWIIPNAEYEPLALGFPQGSTLYMVYEPLNLNPTKYSKIGKVRTWTYGDATDFYSSASGTGILTHAYTFESVEVSGILLKVSGYGGCISIVAVDVR